MRGVTNFVDSDRVIGFENCSPYQCFTQFFPECIYDHVSIETNRYAEDVIANMEELSPNSKYINWIPSTPQDIKALIATEICMGLVKKGALATYFAHDYFMTETPGFSQVFSRQYYELLRSFLHFVDNENRELYKIRPILEFVKNTYLAVYNCGKELSVDETMVKFKGRLFFRQYLPNKPSAKWGDKSLVSL